MKKILFLASATLLLIGFGACKKSDNVSNARTVQNFSGNYHLTALTVSQAGISFDVYDSLPDCEKGNTIQLLASGTANFIDVAPICTPPSDSTGSWSLSSGSDTIYIAGSGSFIKSWDGKTLVISNAEMINNFPLTATSTLVKQ